jgi:hypothetical protein
MRDMKDTKEADQGQHREINEEVARKIVSQNPIYARQVPLRSSKQLGSFHLVM